jgi:hypothetical protein
MKPKTITITVSNEEMVHLFEMAPHYEALEFEFGPSTVRLIVRHPSHWTVAELARLRGVESLDNEEMAG